MKIVCIVLSLLLGSFVAMAQSGEKNFIDQNYIEVSGTAEMEIVPDQIYLKIVISEKDKGKKTVEQQEKAMIAILQKLGIDIRKDLLMKDMSSNFKSYFLKKRSSKRRKNTSFVYTERIKSDLYFLLWKRQIFQIFPLIGSIIRKWISFGRK